MACNQVIAEAFQTVVTATKAGTSPVAASVDQALDRQFRVESSAPQGGTAPAAHPHLQSKQAASQPTPKDQQPSPPAPTPTQDAASSVLQARSGVNPPVKIRPIYGGPTYQPDKPLGKEDQYKENHNKKNGKSS